MIDLTYADKKHIERLVQQEGSVKYIFDSFVRSVGAYLTNWEESESNDLWSRNRTIEKQIKNELNSLQEKLVSNIESYSADAWKRSHAKTDDLVEAYIKDLSISKVAKEGMFARNESALKTFLSRKVDGLTISERVWNIVDGAKTNLEFYLGSGLATGRRADLISQDIRQLLKEPDRVFHRIRNKAGKLVPSAPMKDYHPGTGVYRSSYKNAMRLAVTNTNAIYRQTDCERWSTLDFVIGIEIKRSPSSSYGDCAICDPLAGKYPKTYVFKGWHPWCICIAVPILMEADDFSAALMDDDFSNVEYISDIPASSREFFNDMLSKKTVTTDSYLFQDNKQFFS